MKQLYIKQKVFSFGEKFTIKNEEEQDVYLVEGSFMKIPKTFSVMNMMREEIAHITKKPFSFLPKFIVGVNGAELLTIRKKFSFFKAHYTIDAEGIEVHGNLWDMEFQILRYGEIVGQVNKAWFTWGDSYKVQVLDEEMERLVIAIVVAIDRVKADQSASTTSAHQ